MTSAAQVYDNKKTELERYQLLIAENQRLNYELAEVIERFRLLIEGQKEDKE